MPFLLVLGVILVILVLKIIIGLFTKPVDTIQMLGTWICNTVGLLGLAIAVMLLSTVVFGVSEFDAEGVALIVVGALVAIVAFALSAWLRKRRLRNAYEKQIEAHYAAQEAVMRRRSGRG